MELFGIYFAGAQRFIYLPLLIIPIIFFVRNNSRIVELVKKLVHHNHAHKLFPGFSARRYFFKTLLWVGALLSIFIALLQPQWGTKEETVVQEGRDVLIVLDISRSMLAEDMRPNRLEFTKLKIRNLLTKLAADRAGLILFSGSAFVQCPLTADHAAFLMFLDQVDVETIASGTTAIDSALEKAMDVFKNGQARKNKLIVLATDGEDFSLNLKRVKQKAHKAGVRVFALGVGSTKGAPIPKFDVYHNKRGYEVDERGGVALSRLNESVLISLCKDVNGHYVRATYSDQDIETIAHMIGQFEKETFQEKKVSRFHEQYPWFLALAWILLAVEWIL